MPQTGMDWIVTIGVIAGIVAAIAAVIALRNRPKKTTNTIVGGSHNRQSGGDGVTQNRIENGDHNDQRG